jgi:hypothetical protein
MARKGKGRQKHLADMSLPPAQRRRRSAGRAPDPVPAQMQHGNSRTGRRKRRDGERKMRHAHGLDR